MGAAMTDGGGLGAITAEWAGVVPPVPVRMVYRHLVEDEEEATSAAQNTSISGRGGRLESAGHLSPCGGARSRDRLRVYDSQRLSICADEGSCSKFAGFRRRHDHRLHPQ